MSERTPGPWDVRHHIEVIARDDRHTVVCEVTGSANRRADARFIAAAPDLYEAVKDYLEWGQMTSSDRDQFDGRFRRALAKAEGHP